MSDERLIRLLESSVIREAVREAVALLGARRAESEAQREARKAESAALLEARRAESEALRGELEALRARVAVLEKSAKEFDVLHLRDELGRLDGARTLLLAHLQEHLQNDTPTARDDERRELIDPASLRPTLVSIPAGVGQIGSPPSERGHDEEEEPLGSATIGALWMAKTPVTRAQLNRLMGLSPPASAEAALPATQVTFDKAVAYCNALSRREGLREAYAAPPLMLVLGADGYRLPREEEWEIACRAGDTSTRYGPLRDIAWFCDNAGGQVHPVGELLPNARGLHDMIGNVYEWCWGFLRFTTSPQRALRGGGFQSSPRACRAAHRDWESLSSSRKDVGFRVVRPRWGDR